jgi:protein-histidine pros-kinase
LTLPDGLASATPEVLRQAENLERKFRSLLDAAPDAMLIVERGGQIVFANAHVGALFGYEPTELLGREIEILVPERFRAPHPEHRRGYARAPRPRPMGIGLDLYGRRRDGSEFPVEISLSPMEGEDGALTIAAIRDISERRRLEASRSEVAELAARQAQEANRLKSEFLANMSHELRTPLNAILGFARLMHDGKVGPVSADHKEYLADILTSSQHLLRLINDILDLAKVEAGRVEFYPEAVNTAALVHEVSDMLRGVALARRIAVETAVAPELRTLWIDAAKLKQVLYNYLSNALKFTPEGGRVMVRIDACEIDSFRLEVEDSGEGIGSQDIDRLFVPFQQLDSGPSKRHQGTGLGLALTRRLVEAQGGRWACAASSAAAASSSPCCHAALSPCRVTSRERSRGGWRLESHPDGHRRRPDRSPSGRGDLRCRGIRGSRRLRRSLGAGAGRRGPTGRRAARPSTSPTSPASRSSSSSRAPSPTCPS